MFDRGSDEFEQWVVNNKLDTLLKPKEVKIFKEHNLGYKDLKLFGLTKRITELLLYDWTIYRRKGVGDNWGTHKSKECIDKQLSQKGYFEQ
jgi:hypothetical protein